MQIAAESIKTKRGLLFPVSKKHRSRLFQELVVKSWWVILLFLVCTFTYDLAMKRRIKEQNKLELKLHEIAQEHELAIKKQEDLSFQIKSQNDPAWIELVLMRRLGLVPEGQKKIYFVK